MNNNSNYQPAQLEKVVASAVAILIVGLISFLVIRDKPFSDPNFPVFIRILLSLACAVLGAVIPGFLNVDLKAKGLLIRAGGALALFVITFFFTPNVATSEKINDREVNDIKSRIEMLEATVKLLASTAESPDTNPEDAKELRTVKSEVESVIAKAKRNPQSLPPSSLDVALIIGHSPMRPGALGQINGRNYSEFSYNVELAPLLVRELSSRGLKAKMFLRDSSGSIKSGISEAAARTPHLLIELHANAYNGDVRGCSAMVRANDKEAKALSENILKAIHETLDIPVRKVMKVGLNERGSLALYATTNKAILLHPFFIDNKEDLLIVTQEMDKLAIAISSAIAENLKT